MTTSTAEVTTSNTTALADVGLLILRIGVGAAMLQAGLIKAFDFGTPWGSWSPAAGGYLSSQRSW